MQVDRICTCGSQVIDFWSFWNYWDFKNRISKMEFFSFSGSERLKQNQKIKNIQKLLILHVNHFLNNLRKFRIYFSFFTETLTLALPVPCWGWVTEGEGVIILTYLWNINGFIGFALVFFKLFMLKVYGTINISKIVFFNFSGTERVK